MKKQLISTLCVLMCVYSCTNDLNSIEVDLTKAFEPQIAVTSILIPDSSISVSCMSTYAAYTTKPTAIPSISKAILYDITNNTSYSLTALNTNNSIVLITNDLYPKNGCIYKIVIESTNPTANIVINDTVPSDNPIITDVKISSIQNTSDFFGTITFKPITSLNTVYYELVLFCQDREGLLASDPKVPYWQTKLKTSERFITQEDYYPSLLLLDAKQPQSLLFRLSKKNSINTISFEYNAGEIQSWGGISSIDNNLRIELRVVSFNYFRYKTSLYKQKYAAEGDLLYGMSAPVKVYSNVAGGVGILGSYCKTDTTVFVEGKTYRN